MLRPSVGACPKRKAAFRNSELSLIAAPASSSFDAAPVALPCVGTNRCRAPSTRAVEALRITAIASAPQCQGGGPKISAAFVPPKPNEFDSA
jgi:hypothetical protein